MQTITQEPKNRLARYGLIATNAVLAGDIMYQSGALKLCKEAGSSVVDSILRIVPTMDSLSSATPYVLVVGAGVLVICNLLRRD